MGVVRFVANILLVVITLALMALLIAAAWGYVLPRMWEAAGLAEGASGGNWMWIEHHPIYVYDEGAANNGDTMVLIHGQVIEGSLTWASVMPGLVQGGARVIAVDLKGFGHSAREAGFDYATSSQAVLLAQALNQLRLGPATVVGQGWGCAVALTLAYEQPQFVQSLVLISPLVYETSRPIPQALAKIPYLRNTLVWATSLGGPLWNPWRASGFYDQSAWAAIAPTIRDKGHIVGNIDAWVAMSLTENEDELAQAIPAIGAPALILSGENDTWASAQEGQRLAGELPNAQLRSIPEAGHYVHVEQSRAATRYIEEWARSNR